LLILELERTAKSVTSSFHDFRLNTFAESHQILCSTSCADRSGAKCCRTKAGVADIGRETHGQRLLKGGQASDTQPMAVLTASYSFRLRWAGTALSPTPRESISGCQQGTRRHVRNATRTCRLFHEREGHLLAVCSPCTTPQEILLTQPTVETR
jgi:hypothetical protein